MRGVSMKYMFTLFALSACGVWAANVNEVVVDSAAVIERSETEKSSEEKIGDEILINRAPTQSYSEPHIGTVAEREPIPTVILPNNVCVINTEISPNRSIDEHIMACVVAYRAKQRLTR